MVFGAIPVLALSVLVSIDRIPGTDIDLTVPYAAEGPGPTFNTLGEVDGKQVVEISGDEVDETSGNLNMTTVSVRSGMTLLQAIERWMFTDDDLVPIEAIFPQNMSPEEVQQRNQEAFSTSEASATIAAMKYLGLPVNTEIAGVTEGSPAEGVLKIGDEITAIGDADTATPASVREAVQAKKPGETIDITFLREEKGKKKEHKVSVELGTHPHDTKLAYLGAVMAAIPAGDLRVKYNLEDIGGPSAGLMFSLAVVDKLSPGELTGGKFVAGTGTIDDNGTVGPIGGAKHKVAAAKEAGAEVFLAPEANCPEVKSKSEGITVISVKTLEGAIEALDAYAKGGEYPTCG